MPQFAMTLAMPDDTGASRMACHFASALVAGGHQVIVYHGTPPSHSDGRVAASILPAMKAAGIETQLESRLDSPWSQKLPKSIAKNAACRGVVGVIGVNQRDRCVAIRTSVRLGVPAIICAQNQHRFWGPFPVRWLKRWLYSATMRHSDCKVICTSKHVQQEFVDWFGVHKGRTLILQNAVRVKSAAKVSAVSRSGLRASFGCGDDTFLWVNVGRLDFQKGQDILIDALALLKRGEEDWHLVFVGDVTTGANQDRMQGYFDDLRGQVVALGLNAAVTFAGWRDDVPALLQSADGYIHTARYEGSPLAVLEAMSTATPIVTVDNASRPEGFHDDIHGYVANPGDATDIAKQMARLMATKPDQRRELGSRGRELALQDYDIDAVGKRFCRLVEKFCEVESDTSSESVVTS